VNGTIILKSGTDFRQFSVVTLDFRQNPVAVEVEPVNVTKEQDSLNSKGILPRERFDLQ
jgi:hypothetical protein